MRIPRLVRAAVAALAIAATLGTSAASAGDIVIRRDGSKAVDVPASRPLRAAPIRPMASTSTTPASAPRGCSRSVLASAGVVSLYGRRAMRPGQEI